MTHMGRTEPRLEDLLEDPLVRLLMDSDAVDRDRLSAMLEGMRDFRRSKRSAGNGSREN
ncbi:hypothetical protein [Arenibaculum sp.]|jgi:hypothetical protein|uniref:hypothetical protein n=1 Tax=Arenibaculum sp. TaxID=2865862 RepID=UPI002E0F1DDF|nr:hypothetical protein [Arenibaculum sp.]